MRLVPNRRAKEAFVRFVLNRRERLTRRIENAILMLIKVEDCSCDGSQNEHSRCDVICQKCGDESMRVGRRHMVLSGRSPYGLSV